MLASLALLLVIHAQSRRSFFCRTPKAVVLDVSSLELAELLHKDADFFYGSQVRSRPISYSADLYTIPDFQSALHDFLIQVNLVP